MEPVGTGTSGRCAHRPPLAYVSPSVAMTNRDMPTSSSATGLFFINRTSSEFVRDRRRGGDPVGEFLARRPWPRRRLALVLKTGRSQWVRATDTVTATITGVRPGIV